MTEPETTTPEPEPSQLRRMLIARGIIVPREYVIERELGAGLPYLPLVGPYRRRGDGDAS